MALVLARQVDERVVMQTPQGDLIDILVAEVDKRTGRVKLAIEAPRHIEVDRAEIRALKDLRGSQQ